MYLVEKVDNLRLGVRRKGGSGGGNRGMLCCIVYTSGMLLSPVYCVTHGGAVFAFFIGFVCATFGLVRDRCWIRGL